MTGVLGEHLGYISDSVRTDRLRSALDAIIRPGDVVADLGCGFGIIGLMCLEAGAARVWGIDESAAIKVAGETVKRAGLEERYHCLGMSSYRAVLPEQVDVLVCDHVGYLGFDYGIVALIDDARRRLLKPGGRIMPASLKIDVAGISSPSCLDKATAWAAPSIPSHYHWLRDHGVNSKFPVNFLKGDMATSAGRCMAIDLYNPAPVQILGSAVVDASVDGELHGVGGWFRAELAPNVGMTNSPLEEDSIQREQAFLPFDVPLEVLKGDQVRIEIRSHHRSGVIAWNARNLRNGQSRAQNSWRSQISIDDENCASSGRPVALGSLGSAILYIASQVDGARTPTEIETAVLSKFAGLLPTEEETRRFVRSELSRLAR